MIFLVAIGLQEASASGDSWFFTEDAMATAYRYQRQFGARLRNPLEPQVCLYGEKEFTASYRGQRFAAPCQFVSETIRQLKELLESGAAKHLFPLDVDSADLAVPADVYASKYERLPREQVLPALLREPTLVAIYRTGMHLKPAADGGEGARASGGKKIVLGSYDGRQNRIVVEIWDGTTAQPLNLVRVGGFRMMEHFLGELGFVVGKSAIVFDVSFDDEIAQTPPSNRIVVNTMPR
jgi:hypothetical protein